MEFITDFLIFNSQKHPEKVAVVYENTIISWKELAQKVILCSELLKDFLEEEQKIVGIFLPNSVEFIIAHLAVLYLKHISWPIDPQYKEAELALLTRELKPNLIITDQSRARRIATVRTFLIEEMSIASLKNPKGFRLKGDPRRTAATLLMTSGTTGKPKNTLYSHANHLRNIKTLSKLWRWTEKDTLLLSLPLSHWHGLVIGLTGAIYNGNTIYLQRRFDIEQTLRLLSSGKISLFMHVPPAYQKLVNYPLWMNFDLRRVRLFVSGSSYLPPTLWEEFYSKYRVKILERYGSSEAGIICSNLYNKRVPGSVGKPLSGVKIKLIEEGEIAVKSPNIFMGYYSKGTVALPELKNGFLKTGDIGVIRDDWLFLKGRIQEKIKKLGYSLYPRSIEWVLNRHPDILDSYVLGLQTGTINDEIIYFLVCKRIVTEEQIIAYCRRNMPKYWLPDKVFFVKEIPKTKTGKPKINELLKLYKLLIKRGVGSP